MRYLRDVADAHRLLDEQRFAKAWSAGRELGLEEALAEALATAADQSLAPVQERTSPLTAREAEVAALIARGLTNRQIAERLVIAPRTADNHVQHILDKLGLSTRTQIAAWATLHAAAPK
jgi:DNA-binding NarL/FixJ family response regulator